MDIYDYSLVSNCFFWCFICYFFICFKKFASAKRTRSGKLTVAGTTTTAATNVTVNTTNAVRYADYTFAATNFTLVNGTNTFTAIAKDSLGNVSTNVATANLLATNNYAYDLNGNLRTNGVQVLDYDDENQLIRVTVTNSWKDEFVYDGKLRRRIERDYAWSGGAWSETNETHFIYDGNVVIEERNSNNVPLVTYTRGNDLSGTLQGAGGIGGLLARSDHSQPPSPYYSVHSYYHADGNGNVTMLINASQIMVAKYLYDPYGNTLSMSGPLAAQNNNRFSSKEYNNNAGYYYYTYRYYDPNLQRWLNRDPIQEQGGMNFYGYVGNNPQGKIDSLGLQFPAMFNGWNPYYTPPPNTGYATALNNFGDWVGGHQGGDTSYGPTSFPSQEMSQSTVAEILRNYFLNKNQGKLCKNWQGVSDLRCSFGLTGLVENIPNGTAEFVGSARGDATIVSVNCPNGSQGGSVTVNFKLTNTTSLTSFLYGKWPNSWNVATPGLPFSNWTQTYEWNETFNCKCCNSN